MVFRTTGVGLLALMMRAERTQAGHEPDDLWMMAEAAETEADDDGPMGLLAAE